MSRLELDFSSGITSVVGPNGCGKTNIVDAIRWVLGEQKTRMLRNSKMENVIFNGTKQRKPLGMAQVHITLSNEDRSLPLDYNEVTLSRRLYRSGLSEYLINGNVTRLKTIRGLLFDTGLGNPSYSIIEREMIDSVLSEKEQDKKYLFEEAAGIMRYRSQREDALRKIKLTETDITRLGDILNELDKEVKSLRYQRSRARRYVRLKEQVGGMESALLKHDLLAYLSECDRLKKEKAHHEEITLVDDSEISLRESKLQEQRLHGTQLERRLQELHEQRYTLSNTLQQNDERIAINRERITGNRSRIAESHEEKEKASKRKDELAAEIGQFKERALAFENQIAEIRALLESKNLAFQTVSQDFESVRDRQKRKKDEILAIAEQKSLIAHLEKTLEEYMTKKSAQSDQFERTSRTAQDLKEETDRGKKSCAEVLERITGLTASLGLHAGRKEKIADLIGTCDERYTAASIEQSRLKEKKELLESIKNKHAAGAARAVVTDNGFKGILADLIHVKREHRKCFEACLSPVVESLVAGSKEEAFSSIPSLTANGNGGYQILYPSNNHTDHVHIEGTGILGDALSLIECEPDIKNHLASYLHDVVIVDNVDTALALLEDPRVARVATLEGIFFDGPGRMVIAPSEEIEVTLLEHKAKIEELGSAERRATARAERAQKRKDSLLSSRQTLIEEEKRLASRLSEEKSLESRLLEAYRSVEIRCIKAEEQASSMLLASQDLDETILRLNERIARLTEASHATEENDGQYNLELDGLEERVAELEKDREEARDTLSRLRLEEATVSGELSTLQSKIHNSEMLLVELAELVRSKDADIDRAQEQIRLGEAEIVQLKDGTLSLHERKENTEREIESLNASYEEIKIACDSLEQELKKFKEQRDSKREGLHQCSVALASQETRIATLLERAQEQCNEDLSRYMHNRELFDPSEWENMDKEEFSRLKEQLEQFGPVNMLALEEYEERKERYDFLVKQKADLEEAKDSLLQAIRKINREARRMLNETFELIRANFKATFLSLFDGGEADLMFVDSEDPLEANIKIVASPKGKKLHDISSLSGGERALVALSLLFAIYLVKPSPFCVFDEVDAPLDDANISRFVNMLRSFTDRTQFIVITHNKKTMEAADCLYGVTMQEPGVSKMISVRISDVDKLKGRKSAELLSTAQPEEHLPVRV